MIDFMVLSSSMRMHDRSTLMRARLWWSPVDRPRFKQTIWIVPFPPHFQFIHLLILNTTGRVFVRCYRIQPDPGVSSIDYRNNPSAAEILWPLVSENPTLS